MAMILEAFMSNFSTMLADFVEEEFMMLLGVKDEIQMLRRRMKRIQCLLTDAEKKKFSDTSSTELWLCELKDVMYDAEDVIDLCRIEGAQLLADQNPESRTSSVRCGCLSSAFFCFTSLPLRHEIGNRIKEINERLKQIYEDKERFQLEKSTISETSQISRLESRQTCSLNDSFVVGREVEVAANILVDRIVGEKVDEKCRLFAVTGMGGIGKTTLAQRVCNHPTIKSFFSLDPVWVCVSRTYSKIALLKHIIREAKGRCGDSNIISALQTALRDSVPSGQSLFLVLDDVWTANVWIDLLRVPLYNSKGIVRILITTRDENVANEMQAAYIHPVTCLSEESSWDMLRRRLFSEAEEELAIGFKELGLKIVKKSKGLPLAIRVTAGVLSRKPRTKQAWGAFLRNDAWSISKLPEELRGALCLSFEDLPSHLKQCFLYLSLYAEDERLGASELAQLWVAEGFIPNQQDSLMEDFAEECFNELLHRNLLLPDRFGMFKVHDLVRSLAIVLSKEETSFGDLNVRNSSTSMKLRRLSVENKEDAVEILDSVADQGALRTLLASYSSLVLDDEKLRRLSHLRVLDISCTQIQVLPDSIGNLIFLKYLDLSDLNIVTILSIPESIGKLANLQFLHISFCRNLEQLPMEITQLHRLRSLDIEGTPVRFIPKGIGKLQQLNHLSVFVVDNNDSSNCSRLEELNSLKQLRTLNIDNLNRRQSETILFKELPYVSTMMLKFSLDSSSPIEEQELEVEELINKTIPPQSLQEFNIENFFGRHYPNWMVSPSFKNYLPNLTTLKFSGINSCTQLPPVDQLPELRDLIFNGAKKVQKIVPEFFGSDVNSTRNAFPKLERLLIIDFPELEEWSFGNARLSCLQLLRIEGCPLLKQLPEGLKYSPIKHLKIDSASSLKSVDNLPAEIEELKLLDCKNLEKVCCPPTIKTLLVEECDALAYVEKLDSLQKLDFTHFVTDSLPEWLLKFLRQRGLENESNEDFSLELNVSLATVRKCLKGGIYWDLLQHIPKVLCLSKNFAYYLRYSKQPYVYKSNLN